MTPSNALLVLFLIILATGGNVAAATLKPSQKPTGKAVPSQKPSQKLAPKTTFKPSKSPTFRPSFKVSTLVTIYCDNTLHSFVEINLFIYFFFAKFLSYLSKITSRQHHRHFVRHLFHHHNQRVNLLFYRPHNQLVNHLVNLL